MARPYSSAGLRASERIYTHQDEQNKSDQSPDYVEVERYNKLVRFVVQNDLNVIA